MATTSTRTRSEKGNGVKPVHSIRMGRIVAAIWLNDTKVGPRRNVVLSRLWTDEEGKWQRSSSFGRDDLPVVGKVADLAHSWIFEHASVEPGGHEEAEVPF